jgi:hypothetical protein
LRMVVVVMVMVRSHHVSVAHVGAVWLRSRVVRVWRVAVLRVSMVVIVVGGRRMRRVQLRVGVVVGIHTADGTRGQLAGGTSQICNT